MASCGDIETPDERFDRFMTELVCPVVLEAKTDHAVDKDAVVVRDGEGRIRTFTSYNGIPEAIAYSRAVGDTLKPCLP